MSDKGEGLFYYPYPELLAVMRRRFNRGRKPNWVTKKWEVSRTPHPRMSFQDRVLEYACPWTARHEEAHLAFSRERPARSGSPFERACLNASEDARVNTLAARAGVSTFGGPFVATALMQVAKMPDPRLRYLGALSVTGSLYGDGQTLTAEAIAEALNLPPDAMPMLASHAARIRAAAADPQVAEAVGRELYRLFGEAGEPEPESKPKPESESESESKLEPKPEPSDKSKDDEGEGKAKGESKPSSPSPLLKASITWYQEAKGKRGPVDDTEIGVLADTEIGVLARPPRVVWGKMQLHTLPLTRLTTQPGMRSVTYRDSGDRIDPGRLALPNRFRTVTSGRTGRWRGGSILIDTSGSMNMKTDVLLQAIAGMPASTVVAMYSARRGGTGTVTVLARGGRIAHHEVIRRARAYAGPENVIDGPALEWLGHQPGPRWWVSDGKATGVPAERPESGESALQVKEAAAIAAYHRIRRVETLEDFAALMRRR